MTSKQRAPLRLLSGHQERQMHTMRRYNGGVLAFQVPASAKAGSLDPSQLPFKRLFPDPVDQNNPAVALTSPRGIVIGGPGPLMYVADPGPSPSPAQVLVADPTPPYTVRGALPTMAGLQRVPSGVEALLQQHTLHFPAWMRSSRMDGLRFHPDLGCHQA